MVHSPSRKMVNPETGRKIVVGGRVWKSLQKKSPTKSPRKAKSPTKSPRKAKSPTKSPRKAKSPRKLMGRKRKGVGSAALTGGAIGGLAGGLIAGPAGLLLGAGLGAGTGALIGSEQVRRG